MTRFAHSFAIVTLLASPGIADTVSNRAYSYDKLDGFWQATLGGTPPDAEAFAMFADIADTPEPVSEPALDIGVPIIGELVGETAPAPDGSVQRLAFPVIALPEDEAGPLMRRLAWAELYLSRYAYYVRGTQETAAEIDLMAPRQMAAATEAYLVLARLYFSAPDLPGKCARLTRMAALLEGALVSSVPVSLPAAWQPLLPLRDAAEERLGGSALTDLVCAFEPVRGRAETARLITTRVRERLAMEATAKTDEALRLLRAAAEEFTSLVNAMDVEIKTAEILELERVFGDAAANIRMVQNDQLKAEDTVRELEGVDLSALNQPGEMSEYRAAEAQMAQMIALLDAVLTELAALAPLEPDDGLAVCEGLHAVYDAPDVTRDSFALTASIEGPYVACLAAAHDLVETGIAPKLDTLLLAELARHVGQISSNLLEEVQ